MAAFFAAGACLILFVRGPHGWPAMRQHFNEVRQGQIENARLRQELSEMEEQVKRLRDPRSEETEVLIRDNLQRQKKGEMRFKPADPPAVKRPVLPMNPPLMQR